MMILLLTLLSVGVNPERDDTPQRRSINAAAERIADYIRVQKPRVNLPEDFAVNDLTTDAMWDQLQVQVVKVKEGPVEANETFVLNGEKVHRIGRGVGGDGVTSIVLANLAGDKRPLLIYAFAWGSGLHRSEIGLLDLNDKEPTEIRLKPTNLSMEDFQVRLGAKGDVNVWSGKTLIGTVTAARARGVLQARIKLAESLPDDVRRHFKQ